MSRHSFYTGHVRHRRFQPVSHAFRYGMFMVHLDLDALDAGFPDNVLLSLRRRALVHFRRADYFGDPQVPLAAAIRELVAKQTSTAPTGRVTLLTHLRYFGVSMNPVSFYFCWCADGARLEAVVLEVTNTPWGERHQYVIDYRKSGSSLKRFEKAFHVSPFLPMAMEYRLACSGPAKTLVAHLENWQAGEKVLDATLVMRRRDPGPFTAYGLLLRYPLMTLRVLQGIYYQAFRLWRKGVAFHAHPASKPTLGTHQT